jgi:putative endonuclease
MADKSHREIGNNGEDLACAFLESKGWTILDRNFFFDRAEVDVIAQDGPVIVFLEVKLRSTTKFGQPFEHVTKGKVKNVFKAAEAWIRENDLHDSPLRFDIIGIVKKKNQAPEFNHIEDAYR